MKQAPNIISALRIVLSAVIFFQKPFSTEFYILYSLCGISDISDGYAARKFKAESKFGAGLDSLADIAFMLASARSLLPILKFKKYVIALMLAVLLIRIIGIVLGLIIQKKLIFLHTLAEKITGILLFASVYFVERIDINILALPLCAVAGYAALQEALLIAKAETDFQSDEKMMKKKSGPS